MGSNTPTYDFIVVGAGPAGVMVATTLAQSKKRPSVLLIEGGGPNDAKDARIDTNRWITFMTHPYMNYGYETVPQELLNNRPIPYHRGRGLGGSTAINFSFWTVPPKDDFEYIAQLTGDQEWHWENVQNRIKRIESYYSRKPYIPDGMEKYLKPDTKEHGNAGPISVGFAGGWQKSLFLEIDAFAEGGHKRNLDHNDGDPIGVAICASSAFKGHRSTSADALKEPIGNLTVITDTDVARVLFNDSGKKATGVISRKGDSYHATYEVILSAGSLSTPHILMHSGVGPSDQLQRYQIPVLHDNASIGSGLKDHYHAFITFERADHTSSVPAYFRSKDAQAAALVQWQKDGSGPLAEIACTCGIDYSKLPAVTSSAEFAALPPQVQTHLEKSTVPHCEFVNGGAIFGYFMAPETYPAGSDILMVIMNPQSSGTCALQSSDPAVPLLFDPKFFSHPYDRRVAIETTREVLRITNSTSFAKDTIKPMLCPASDSEEDIMEHWKEQAGSTWHMCGTCKMTKSEDEDGACVDTDFRVWGVNNLRVADMSVYPMLPNAHTQTSAYLVGMMAGDKLVKEYGLGQ